MDETANVEIIVSTLGGTDSVSLRESIVDSFVPMAADTTTIVPVDSLFGSYCTTAPNTPPPAEAANMLTANTVYYLSALALTILFIVLMLKYRNQIWQLFKLMRLQNPASKPEDEMSFFFTRFLLLSNLLFTLMAAVAVVRSTSALGIELGTKWANLTIWAVPLLTVAIVALFGVQTFVLTRIRSITGNGELCARLIMYKRLIMSEALVLLTPAVLLFVLNGSLSSQIIFYVIAAMALMLTFQFIANTFLLFLKAKVSIFLWFLYLCTVEIVPIGTILAIIVFNR